MAVFPSVFTQISLRHCDITLKQVHPKPSALKVHGIDAGMGGPLS